MVEFVKVATTSEIAAGERKIVDFEDVSVALFNVNDVYYCIEDVCTHDGGPLAEGILNGFSIACPRHGALFDIRDGAVLSMPAVIPVPTYKVKIEGNDIYVESPDAW
jgi:3-phenylpropionate/trans-cinnamate dioxygenase ferredoxin subunit